jgi:hypothetical protein
MGLSSIGMFTIVLGPVRMPSELGNFGNPCLLERILNPRLGKLGELGTIPIR